MNGSMAARGLLAAVAGLLVAAPAAGAVTASNTTPIGPNDTTPSVSPVTISGQAGTVSSVRVALEQPGIDAPGDVDMLLIGPGGQRGIVMSDACAGGSFSNAAPLAFATGAGALLDNCGTMVAGGTYGPTDVTSGGADSFPAPAPAGPYPTGFGAFTGSNPNGTWTLYTVDDEANGQLMFIGGGWTLDVGITPTVPAPAPQKKCKKGKKLKKGKCVKKKKKKGKKR